MWVHSEDCEFRCREPAGKRVIVTTTLYTDVRVRILQLARIMLYTDEYEEWISQRVPFLFLRGLVRRWVGLAAVAIVARARSLYTTTRESTRQVQSLPAAPRAGQRESDRGRDRASRRAVMQGAIQCAISFRKYCILRPREHTRGLDETRFVPRQVQFFFFFIIFPHFFSSIVHRARKFQRC